MRHLYKLYPDFKIDIEAEQRALLETDRIVLQFPIYWYSSPALLKQWQDDVLTYGWAYGSRGKALHGKELMVAVSPGAGLEEYTRDGEYGYTMHEFLRPFEAMSDYTGMTYVKPFVTTGSLKILDERLSRSCSCLRGKL